MSNQLNVYYMCIIPTLNNQVLLSISRVLHPKGQGPDRKSALEKVHSLGRSFGPMGPHSSRGGEGRGVPRLQNVALNGQADQRSFAVTQSAAKAANQNAFGSVDY